MKTKVLYILHDIQVGGVEIALTSAIPRLHAEFDLRVMVLGKVDPHMVAHLSDSEKACFYTFPASPVFYPLAIFKMIAFILNFNPQIMICSLWRASMVGVITKLLQKKTHFISFVHNTYFFHKADAFFTRLALRHANFIFVDSAASGNFVKDHFNPKAPVKVISFLTRVSPEEKPGLSVNDLQKRFIFLGRINSNKNIPLAIDTIIYLRKHGINATLDIYGRDDGALKNVLSYINENNMQSAISWKGELNPVQKWPVIAQYHFLIQLSIHEGMAMSVSEAMQTGLVCFVQPAGEIPNYSSDMHDTIFADITTPEAWQHSLKKLESVCTDADAYATLSQAAFARFKKMDTFSTTLTTSIYDIIRSSRYDR